MDLISCDTSEIEEKPKCTRITNGYSYHTMVNNWENERALREAHMAVLSYKKVHCQLLSSRTRAMLRNVLAAVQLSPCTAGIEYNKIYQICSPSLPKQITQEYPYSQKGLFLSGVFSEENIDKGTELMHGCFLSASPESMPCRRNTFIFRSDTLDANNIYYGDDVFIEINSGTATPLYVQAENNLINSSSNKLTLRLSQQRDVYTHFKILHSHPKHRKDSIGMIIPPGENVIIQHMASGKNLAADGSSWVTTFMGVECMASCCTYRNSNRINTAENMWKIMGHADAPNLTLAAS